MKIEIDGVEILDISETDIACMENDLIDVKTWIKAAVVGKINNCKKRLIRTWQPKLIDDLSVESIPANEKGIITAIITRTDCHNRKKRDKMKAEKEAISKT